MQHLFVYGTLAPGRPNHHVLADIPGDWQPATLRGELREEGWGAAMGCPGLVPGDHGGEVDGHLLSSLELEQHWTRLDAFEGDGYRRIEVEVRLESGVSVSASVYALNTA